MQQIQTMHLTIIEAPSNLGLKQLTPNLEPGVRKLPEWLRAHGLHQQLSPSSVSTVNPPPYSMYLDPESGVRNADAIASYSKDLASAINQALDTAAWPLVLGGDCSILIGCTLALKKRGKFGLFFLDGHTDYLLPDASRTQGAAGMDLAIVTGKGHDKLANISSQRPYIQGMHAWAAGNRYLSDAFYVNEIIQSDLHYSNLYMMREKGMSKVAAEFLAMVDKEQLDGFWIHLDVDVLNNELMPCVDSPQPDGLSYQEAGELLKALLNSGKAVGMDITILDPDLDPKGHYAQQFINWLKEILS
jgi:arginase